jgi:cold shock CspA family protein
MNRYQVLWIDDDAEKQDGFLDSAYLNGLDINYYKTSKQGMEELISKIEQYDAVILDAMVYNESEDEKAALTGLFNSIKRINGLVERKKIPYFIFSGYIDQDEHASAREMLADETIFIKSKDNKALFQAIKEAADKQTDTQIRHKHQRVFDVCKEKYIGEAAGRDLLGLLLSVDSSTTENQFNSLRKIVEDIFMAFNKFQLLPNEFITPTVAINESSKFLSGKNHKGELFTEKGYQHLEETHIPEQISAMLWNILNSTQNGSHRSTIDQHEKRLNTSYLIQSVLYQLLDVIVWFKIHIDSNPQKENWTKIDNKVQETISNIKTGEVINLDVYKGFAFFKPEDGTENVFIPPHLVTNHTLKETDVIIGEIEEYTDNRTQEQKKRVKKLIE